MYLLNEGRYETRDEYRDRVLKDLTLSRTVLRQELGIDCDVLVWPYGEHNDVARRVAAEAGFRTTLGLEGACVWASDVEGATDVWLSTCSDPAGAGYLESAYFMNHQIPVRADIWSMTAIRMKRAGFRVWARVPALNLTWARVRHPEWRLAYEPTGERWPFRLSPDLPEAQGAARDFMNDLAVYVPLDGVIFETDARLGDGNGLRSMPDADAATKDRVMNDYLETLERTVLAWRPHCVFARAGDVASGNLVSSGSP